MKLATALSRRSDLQIKINELSNRLNHNAKVQSGSTPSEDPHGLIQELNHAFEELEELIYRINLTNASTYKDGISLTGLLAKRDVLKLKVRTLRSFLDEASAKVDRYSRSEIMIESTIEVKALQKEVDDVSKELRLLDESIQELNWTTELQ